LSYFWPVFREHHNWAMLLKPAVASIVSAGSGLSLEEEEDSAVT